MQDFTSLPTQRLVLRRFEDRDLEALVAYRSDPAVARYQSWSEFDHARGQALIDGMRERWPGQPGWFQFAIALRESDALVGDLALRVDGEQPRLGEVGFTLASEQQGRGLAGEAVRALLDYAFSVLGMHRLMAVTDASNAPAAALLERVGMRREGHFLQHVWFKGAWGDEFLYAILAEEWASSQARALPSI